MAIEKQIKSRIIHKHDIEANWNRAETFIPKQGEIIVYDIDENYTYERMKIGDGKTTIINLPFVMDNLVNVYIQKTSITDNLTTTAKDKPLSANQGYVLNQAVNNMKRSISNLQDDVDDLADTAATEEFVNQAIAAIPTPDVSGQIGAHNTDIAAHADIRSELNSEKESKPFGYKTEYTTVLAEGTYTVYNQNMYGTPVLSVSAPSLVAGETYIVTLNGEKTTWVAYSSGENVCVGTGETVTNKPIDSVYIVSTSSGVMMIYLKNTGVCTISIGSVTNETVTMPIDLLPDTVATKADIEAAIGIAIGGSY